MKYFKHYYLWLLLLLIFTFSSLTIFAPQDAYQHKDKYLYIIYRITMQKLATEKGRKEFKQYYAKIFFSNDYLKNLYALINVKVLHVLSFNYAILGRNNSYIVFNNLHHKCKGNNCLENETTMNYFFHPLNKKLLINQLNLLDCKSTFIKNMGLDYLLFLIPRKEVIYPEQYPLIFSWLAKKINAKKNPYNYDAILTYYLTKYSKVTVINFHEKILKAKDLYAKEGLSLYYSYDGHWNMLGAYLGYSYLMENIKNYNHGKYSKLTYATNITMTYKKGVPLVHMPMVNNFFFYPKQWLEDTNISINGIAQDNLYLYDKEIYEFSNEMLYRFYVERDSFFFNIIPLIKTDVGYIRAIQHTAINEKNILNIFNSLKRKKIDLFIDEYAESRIKSPDICQWLNIKPSVDYNKILETDKMNNTLEFATN